MHKLTLPIVSGLSEHHRTIGLSLWLCWSPRSPGPGWFNSKARSGEFGCIALAWWNGKKNRAEMKCALTGSEGTGRLKPNVWYTLNESGEFIEVAE